MIRLLTVLLITLNLPACGEGPVVDPVTHATYYVINETDGDVLFRATRLWSEEVLEVTIPAREIVELDRVTEGSGGHVLPSNFYGPYSVTPVDGGTVLFPVNADWQTCPADAVPRDRGRRQLCLLVAGSIPL